MRAKILSCSAVAGAAILLSSATADASGYLTTRFGGDHGTPAMPNAYAIYFNPAALGGTKGTTLTGDLSLLVRWAHYERTDDALSPSPNAADRLRQNPDYVRANTGNANLLNLLALPFFGVNTDFGSKYFRGGFAVYVPFGGMATWDRDRGTPAAPGSSDGPQRWHNISGQLLAVNGTFAGAIVIPDSGFSIGLSVTPTIHRVETVRARTRDDSDDTVENDNVTLKEGRSYLEATGFNLGGSAGLYWQSDESQRVRLGITYISQPGFGQTRMRGTLQGRTAGGDVSQDIDFLQTYPDVLRIGGSVRLPGDKVEIRSDAEFVRWSVFERQCIVARGKECNVAANGSAPGTDVILNIPRNWKNAGGYRLGVGYFLNDSLELFGSAAFTTSAVPKETIDASTIDSFRLYGALGARYQFSRHFAMAGSYNHIYYLPVETKGANKLNEFQQPSRSPSADGNYTSQIGFVNINAAYTF